MYGCLKDGFRYQSLASFQECEDTWKVIGRCSIKRLCNGAPRELKRRNGVLIGSDLYLYVTILCFRGFWFYLACPKYRDIINFLLKTKEEGKDLHQLQTWGLKEERFGFPVKCLCNILFLTLYFFFFVFSSQVSTINTHESCMWEIL